MTFKIDLRPGSKLSERFSNRRDCYKVVEADNVLGYIITPGGRASVVSVYPLYCAYIHVKAGKTWHHVSSYEQGDRLNDYTFHTDYEGCTFATIAAQSIRALEERHHLRKLAEQGETKSRRRKKNPLNKRARKETMNNAMSDPESPGSIAAKKQPASMTARPPRGRRRA